MSATATPAVSPLSPASSASSTHLFIRRFNSARLSFPFSPLFSLSLSSTPKKASPAASRAPYIAEQDQAASASAEEAYRKELAKPCELYFCNIPRSFDISELLDLFKPHGTVQSVEVTRNSETGLSRGCGYVTMNSVPEAKSAITALDGSDLGGREIRVRFSSQMVPGRKNSEALTSAPKLGIVFESPHKAYVGNLVWSLRPEDLRQHFSQFGTVVSARVLFDKKWGRSRTYGFISFSSADELKAATGASGLEFRGRELVVREVVNPE